MIIISVYGGIGNQMFQYALGKSLSNILNEKVKYEYSYNLTRTDFNPADIDSIFNIFDLSGELASQKEIQYFKGPQNINIKILAKLFQKTHKFFYKKRRKIFFEEIF